MPGPGHTRGRLFTTLAGAGMTLRYVGRVAFARQAGSRAPNRPLIVASKTLPQVREKITAAGIDALRNGGDALDAANRQDNP
jgi:hypothetical protein